ncbi:MAG: hypothetical protein HRT69_13930 [Flavobacteriaceae bacterium]|nr:hypothetical protein [Flavobacteriaceae bacterium]
MKEFGIDSMKYRKSTHLAGVDVESIISEKGICKLVIKDSYYDTNVDVSGNKTDGYFVEFENQKPMVVNSGNRKQIAKIYKDLKKCSSTDSRNISNWIGLEIELYFDENVKMMGKRTGGIKVKYILPENKADDKKALEDLGKCKSLNELKTVWSGLSNEEQILPTVLAKKEQLKNKLK